MHFRCVSSYGHSASRKPATLDHIYGFLGLASAAAKSNVLIKPDYSKTRADVLLDVLRFERDAGVKQTQLLADYHYLRKLLKISTFHLGRVVRNNQERLQSHMYAMLGSSSVTAPLCLVSDVVAIQTSSDRCERLKSRFNKGERKSLGAKWRIQRFRRRAEYRKELGVSRRHRARLHLGQRRALLKPRGRPAVEEPHNCVWRFKDGWTETQRDQHMIDQSIEHMFEELLSTSANDAPGETPGKSSARAKAVDFCSTFLQSFDQNPWLSASKSSQTDQHQDRFESTYDYTSFIGTGGLRGTIIAEPSTTYQLWRHGGYGGPGIIQIWQFDGFNDCNGGIVVRKFQRKSSLVSYTPIGFAFFANAGTVGSGLDDVSCPTPGKPSSFFEDPARADSASEDSDIDSGASDSDWSDLDGTESDDSDFHELDEGTSAPFEDGEDNDPLLATPGSYDPFHEVNRGGIHVRLDLPAMLELQRCGVLSQDQLKHIGERWLIGMDTVQAQAAGFDIDLTRC